MVWSLTALNTLEQKSLEPMTRPPFTSLICEIQCCDQSLISSVSLRCFGLMLSFFTSHTLFPLDEGRWDCKQMTTNASYVPTEENANTLESWNQTGGHVPLDKCITRKGKRHFGMVQCGVNCYTQWFSSLGCPEWNVPVKIQYEVAKQILNRYNFIVVLEKLKDKEYVSAVEAFFGVPGLTNSKGAWCEVESHNANARVPLVVKHQTLQQLTRLNGYDIDLYNNMSSCLKSNTYNFPKWKYIKDRFAANSSLKIFHTEFGMWKNSQQAEQRLKQLKQQSKQQSQHIVPDLPSPACKPHFKLALPNGEWSDTTQFKRLYFYHSRKAGGTSLRKYFASVAKHHGLEFVTNEFGVAEDPGSHIEPTFYVTNMREPVARSISAFRCKSNSVVRKDALCDTPTHHSYS